ncbi:hypothetical protein DR64_2263 [Paraburkholderia xenovorans LB400]|uniref:hypothetical protein n=1 Tax=Paraburkholderia xenovorans TaxID=36873 RepID=UPI00003C4BC3|nr:hypothetical protein [Paraburkholderia xenovorans]AIP29814.1 hypothetical protein DR64_2263 [Paraburkholderia xenovorans LB400]
MDVLLADTAVDVELVSRELGLTEVMSERLRRALDRLECVAAVLETMRPASGGYESAEVVDAAGCAVEELAVREPQDYPAGALEWVMLAD